MGIMTDNIYKNCPPLMSDGRNFTDYRPSQVRESYFSYINNLKSEHDARHLRSINASKFIDNEWNEVVKKNGCFPKEYCYHTNPTVRTTNKNNNVEILIYNGVIPATKGRNNQ